MSNFAKRILFVGNSTIHGCGLFTLIDLVEGQMVVEYTGEIIRQSLTDQRERENEQKVKENKKKLEWTFHFNERQNISSKGVGCYLFALDSTNVIDATYQGNQARFINHNCQVTKIFTPSSSSFLFVQFYPFFSFSQTVTLKQLNLQDVNTLWYLLERILPVELNSPTIIPFKKKISKFLVIVVQENVERI